MPYTYPYPRFGFAVDAVLFVKTPASAKLLLIQRKAEPFKDCWAFPGGFVDPDELLDDAVLRELHEETGITDVSLQRLGVYDALDRDPRERIVSQAYCGWSENETPPKAADDAADARWFDLENLPKLAFDHADILRDACRLLNIAFKN